MTSSKELFFGVLMKTINDIIYASDKKTAQTEGEKIRKASISKMSLKNIYDATIKIEIDNTIRNVNFYSIMEEKTSNKLLSFFNEDCNWQVPPEPNLISLHHVIKTHERDFIDKDNLTLTDEQRQKIEIVIGYKISNRLIKFGAISNKNEDPQCFFHKDLYTNHAGVVVSEDILAGTQFVLMKNISTEKLEEFYFQNRSIQADANLFKNLVQTFLNNMIGVKVNEMFLPNAICRLPTNCLIEKNFFKSFFHRSGDIQDLTKRRMCLVLSPRDLNTYHKLNLIS